MVWTSPTGGEAISRASRRGAGSPLAKSCSSNSTSEVREFFRGDDRRDCNLTTENCRLKSNGTVDRDFFIKHLNYNLSDAAIELLFKEHLILCSTKTVFQRLRVHLVCSLWGRATAISSQCSQTFAFTTQTLNYSFPSRVSKHRDSICLQASRHALRRGIRYWHKHALSDIYWVTLVPPRPGMVFWKHQPLSQWKGPFLPNSMVLQQCSTGAQGRHWADALDHCMVAWALGIAHCSCCYAVLYILNTLKICARISTWMPSTLTPKPDENWSEQSSSSVRKEGGPIFSITETSFPHSPEPLLFRGSQRQPSWPGPPPPRFQDPSTFRSNTAPAIAPQTSSFWGERLFISSLISPLHEAILQPSARILFLALEVCSLASASLHIY